MNYEADRGKMLCEIHEETAKPIAISGSVSGVLRLLIQMVGGVGFEPTAPGV